MAVLDFYSIPAVDLGASENPVILLRTAFVCRYYAVCCFLGTFSILLPHDIAQDAMGPSF